MREPNSVMHSFKLEGKAEGMAEGMAMGMLEAKRSAILRALQLRFHGTIIPGEVSALVRGLTDLDQLGQCFDSAVTAPSMEAFRAMVRV